MTFWDNTTIQTLADGDIVLVGEEHGNVFSKDLMRRVLNDVDPGTLAVEKSPGSWPLMDGGMGRAAQFAEDADRPLLAIDKPSPKFRARSGSRAGLLQDANEFSHPITVDGDVEVAAISNARQRVRDNYGHKTHREMYTEREKEMAGNLKAAIEEYPTPIVAGIGTFHILALRDIYPLVEPNELTNEKILKE